MIPQAFTTRDTTEAYRWLMTLPQSVRDEMKSMEQVVSLYLRAKRLGGGIPTTEELSLKAVPSKSSQDFQKNLKDLQHELEQFDVTPDQNGSQAQTAQASQGKISEETLNGSNSASQNQFQNQNLMASLRMDPKSRQIIAEVREGLNLSSDMEVIRMSLVIAHKSLRELMK